MQNQNHQLAAAFRPNKILFVVPAAPGFYVVAPIHEDHGQIFDAAREPIVAWAIDELNVTWPVTLLGVRNDGDDLPMLCPDGQVHDSSTTWDSLGHWLADQKAEAAADSLV